MSLARPFSSPETHMPYTAAMPLSDLSDPRRICEINDLHLFLSLYSDFPNTIGEKGIQCIKAIEWMEKTLNDDILKKYEQRRYCDEVKEVIIGQVCYVLRNELIVSMEPPEERIFILYSAQSTSQAETLLEGLQSFKQKNRKKHEIGLVINGRLGLDIRHVEIAKINFKIKDNYNDDFLEIHKQITTELSKKDATGLVLLHGKPGTGKTSYIRYLITRLKKEVIFLPPTLATNLSSPSLLNLMRNYPNSILVIEDAENIISARETTGSSAVADLLNITDGLLGDCLRVQIICTFNTDIRKIDQALLRNGRLIASYEFKELSVEKAQQLSIMLGQEKQITEPMTLSNIYNTDKFYFQRNKTKKSIGFNRV